MSEPTRPATTACTRAESGSTGPIQIPSDRYYGTHATRSLISLPRRLIAFTIVLAALFGLTGCVVQSVYSWYGDEDVVFDGNLAGAWIREGPMKGCLLNITADPTRQVRHYNIEVSTVPGGCQDLNSESAKLSGGGQMVQSGRQRFFDVWDDRCGLHTLLLRRHADDNKLFSEEDTMKFHRNGP